MQTGGKFKRYIYIYIYIQVDQNLRAPDDYNTVVSYTETF